MASILTAGTDSGASLFSFVIQKSFRAPSIEVIKGMDSCPEEKCLEGGDRGRVYHLPVLFQPFDGGI